MRAGTESLTTFAQDYAAMHEALVERGAAEAPIHGSVYVSASETALRAIYHVTHEPPAILQVIATGHGNLTATVTYLSVSDKYEDTPLIAQGRLTMPVSTYPAEVIQQVAAVPMAARLGEQGEGIFDQAVGLVKSFQKFEDF